MSVVLLPARRTSASPSLNGVPQAVNLQCCESSLLILPKLSMCHMIYVEFFNNSENSFAARWICPLAAMDSATGETTKELQDHSLTRQNQIPMTEIS